MSLSGRGIRAALWGEEEAFQCSLQRPRDQCWVSRQWPCGGEGGKRTGIS